MVVVKIIDPTSMSLPQIQLPPAFSFRTFNFHTLELLAHSSRHTLTHLLTVIEYPSTHFPSNRNIQVWVGVSECLLHLTQASKQEEEDIYLLWKKSENLRTKKQNLRTKQQRSKLHINKVQHEFRSSGTQNESSRTSFHSSGPT